MSQCPICIEPFNQKDRQDVRCHVCQYSSCSTCVRKFLLDVDDPQCISCKVPWSKENLEQLPKAFVRGDLKKHREEVLLNREMNLLPSTQLVIQEKKDREKIKEKIRSLKREIYKLQTKLDTQASREERAFVRKCPQSNCNGFLNSRFKCGICEVSICSICLEVKSQKTQGDKSQGDETQGDQTQDDSQEHVCDPNIVSSVQMIKKDSKPCPKCKTLIFRIYGCHQMYCTFPGCDTAFDWVTLRILDKKRVHNPHLYDYLMRQGQPNIDRDGCDDDFPHVTRVVNVMRNIPHSVPYQLVMRIHRFVNHVRSQEIVDRYPAFPDILDPRLNEDVRIKFLQGEIDREKLKWILQKREKARELKQRIHNVVETFVLVSSDLFIKLIAQISASDDNGSSMHFIEDFSREFSEIRKYTNSVLEELSEKEGITVPVLDEDLRTPLRTRSVKGAES